jgi:hypothetical protein
MSAAVYRLCLERGHLIVEIDGRCFLVDTGSPLSFARRGTLTLAGKTYSLPTSGLGTDADTVGALANLQIDGLLGLDILGEFDVVFDVASAVMVVHTERQERPPGAATVTPRMGLLMVDAECSGRVCKAFLDSGAQYSYLPRGLDDGRAGKTKRDFHPFLGRFRVVLRRTLGGLRVGGLSIKQHRHAEPPEILEKTLSALGVEGVVGTSLFTVCRVGLSMRGGWFGELAGSPVR